MKTHEVLSTPEAQLAPKLKAMKQKELERHAQKLLMGLGQPDYDAVLSAVIKVVPNLGREDANKFAVVQGVISGFVDAASNDSDADKNSLERVAVILMMIITRKFNKILSGQ